MRLAESNRQPARRPGATTVSIGVHAALILVVVHASASGTTSETAPPPEPIMIWHAPPLPQPERASTGGATDRDGDQSLRPRQPLPLPLPGPAVPLREVEPFVNSWPEPFASDDLVTTGAFDGRGPRSPSGPGPSDPGSDVPFSAATVERSVRPLSGAPRFPEAQRRRSESGYVIVRFVVDTAGRVEENSTEIVEASHDAFVVAVREALPNMRFVPAEAHGRRVRQLVEQRFEFRLR